jgi:hypothetical protein
VCSAVVSIGILVRGLWSGRADAVKLHAFVWLAVVINAGIMAASSNPDDRYQARLVWLIPFSVLVSLSRQLEARRQSRSGGCVHTVPRQSG